MGLASARRLYYSGRAGRTPRRRQHMHTLTIAWLVVLYDFLDDAYLDSLLCDTEAGAIVNAMDDIAHELQQIGLSPEGRPLG